jgi:endonuclease/exonuclease/phosphatase family metal-dependent hydrolase
VIGFQEALRGASFDQMVDLLDGFGYPFGSYAPAIPFWEDERYEFGNAIASRWPFASAGACPLPDAGDGERRVALCTLIEAPFGLVPLTCTHLNWKLHHGWVRERQVVALGAIARRHRAETDFPPLIAGDFNAEPDSAEMRYLTGLQSLDGSSVHFFDAWRLRGAGDPATWSNRNAYARAALDPDRRIDYILCGPPLPDGTGLVEECRVVCDADEDGVWPSDHFGLFARLRSEPLER